MSSSSTSSRPDVWVSPPATTNGAVGAAPPIGREAMLHAAAFVARCFLSDSWEAKVAEALDELGRALGASRLDIIEKIAPDTPRFSLRYTWCAPGIEPTPESCYNDYDLNDIGFGAWARLMEGGEAVEALVKDLAPQQRAALEHSNIVSVINVPIFLEGKWWGYVGVDDCVRERIWSEAERETLRLCADLLGAGVARGQSELALRESEAELLALLGLMSDALFIIDRAGVYRKVITSNPDILIQPPANIPGRALREFFDAATAWKFEGAIACALDTRAPARLEYSLHLDGGDKWFEATVTPLNDDEVVWVARDVSASHRDAQALRDSEQLFRLLAENSSDAISRISPQFQTLYVSPAIENIIGYAPEELIGRHPLETVHPDDVGALIEAYGQSLRDPSRVATVVYRRLHREGHYVWCESAGRAVIGPSGEVEEIQIVTRDISARKRAEEQLREAELRYRSIFENAVEGIFQTSPDGRYLAANPSLARIYGFDSPAQLIGSYSDISRELYVNDRKRAEFIEEMRKQGKVSNFEAQIRRKDGQVIWISENAREVRGDGELRYYEGTVEDITDRKNAQDQLLHNALHDKLTGLANRALFSDRLAQAFARLKRHPTAIFAVLFLDFDRFKNINDSLGHMAGDELLVALARRLEECLRPGDTVSRLGGDEFAILLEDVRDQTDATVVAERVQSAMAAPFTLVGQEVFSSASIGIALAHAGYDNPDDLLRDADMAMYRAKSLGKARHEVFDSGMHTRAVALLQLETDLRWAIERREFELHYQPIISLQSGAITGMEALVRWRHPERGLVSPAEFIPVAEETGWIVPIGAWVLETACEQLALWQAELRPDPPLTMSVNLSGKQFSQPNLIPFISEQLAKWNIAPQNLKLEITESAIMENAQAVTERLHTLRALGVQLALDDFGTGYSSLSYLHRFPLDTLKIDRSFVMRMEDGGENREIVRTIVALGLNLGMDVVAEGIEDARQLSDLRALNCKGGQGFFFSRPLPPDAALKLLQSGVTW